MDHLMCCNELMHEVIGSEDYEIEGIIYSTKYFFCFRCHGIKMINSQHKVNVSSISGREI